MSDKQIVDMLVSVQTEYVPKSEVVRLNAEVERLTRELDNARAWSARWKAVAKRIWTGVHHPLDKCEFEARRREAADGERDAALARIAALEWSLGVSEEERVAMVGASGRLRDRVAALERVARASQGIIHEGLHGGRPTDPEHQELCEMPACRRIRAALAAAAPGEGEGA